jgi:regulator of cell morphogenesis and NO signaling
MRHTDALSPIRLLETLTATDDRVQAQLARLRAQTSWPPALEPLIARLADQVSTHLHRERHLLLPCLRDVAVAATAGRPHPPCPYPTLAHPMRIMEAEHHALLASLAHLHDLTNGYTTGAPDLPDGLSLLRNVDAAVREHVRIADHELFPCVLDLEAGLA